MTVLTLRRIHPPLALVVAAGMSSWLAAWLVNAPLADWAAYELLALERGSQLGDAVAFFLYDLPKVLLLRTGVVTAVSFLRSFVSPERVRRALAGRGVLPGTMAAAGFGVITPFCRARPCRCSSASSRRASRSAWRSRSSCRARW